MRRKRLRVGTTDDLRTVLTVTSDGVDRNGGPDVSLPVSETRLTRLRDRFEAVRLGVTVEHEVGDETFEKPYRADRAPFNRLEPGDTTAFAVRDADHVTTLDPDSPFYDERPW